MIAREPELAALHLSDLALAHACAKRMPRALFLLETRFLVPLGDVLAKHHGHSNADEALQRLRTRLLIDDSSARGRLATYSGLGPLKHWLKIAAVRELMRVEHQTGSSSAPEALALEQLVADADPELDVALTQNKVLFRQTLATALNGLTVDERDLLRRYFVERQSIDVLAAELGAHRATMARRLVQLRKRLHAVISEELAAHFQASESALGSVLRAFRAQLDITLDRYLR